VDTIVLQVASSPAWFRIMWRSAILPQSINPQEQTKLQMEIIPGSCAARTAGRVSGFQYNLKCPKCGSEHLDSLSGREFIIQEITPLSERFAG
jgi:Zn finger protein HypA/HybF involved in hydrogenase expression